MNFVQIMATCDSDILGLLSIVKLVIRGICWVVPIVIIVLIILDIAKIVTSGNIDDKLKKEILDKITTRIIYAVIIFLVPMIIGLLFRILGNSTVIGNSTKGTSAVGCTWSEAWDQA